MKFATKKRGGGAVINLTPLIDCMFLLVIFIMIVARFDPEGGLPVALPTARAGAAAPPETIHVTVTSDGLVYLADAEVSIEELPARIVAARTALGEAQGDPTGADVVLVVHGDKEAMHGRVVEVMDAAAAAKQQKVTIRTRGGN